MMGIEVHKPYLDQAWMPPHRSQIPRGSPPPPEVVYIHGDARDEMERIAVKEPKGFDGVMMIDFIEHLEEEDALRLIDLAEKIARKRIWLWLPEGVHPQDADEWGLGGDYWQTHRSTWYAKDLERLGFDVAVWDGHHKAQIGEKGAGNAMFAVKELLPNA